MAKSPTVTDNPTQKKRVRKTSGKPQIRRGHGKMPKTVIMAKVGMKLKSKADVVNVPREEVDDHLSSGFVTIKREQFRKLADPRSQKKEKKKEKKEKREKKRKTPKKPESK
jgi:hypothetical protein